MMEKKLLDSKPHKKNCTVETLTDEIDVVEGMRLDRGYLSPHFVTDSDRMEVNLEEPLFLITDQ